MYKNVDRWPRSGVTATAAATSAAPRAAVCSHFKSERRRNWSMQASRLCATSATLAKSK